MRRTVAAVSIDVGIRYLNEFKYRQTYSKIEEGKLVNPARHARPAHRRQQPRSDLRGAGLPACSWMTCRGARLL